MTEQELAEIGACLAAITPGPWAWEKRTLPPGGVAFCGPPSLIAANGQYVINRGCAECRADLGDGSEADDAFIAAAPTYAPALLAEVTRVRALIEEIYPLPHDEMCQLRAEWRLPMEERECTCYIGRNNVLLAQALGVDP